MVEIKSTQAETIPHKSKLQSLPSEEICLLTTKSKASCWYVYILRCKNNALYTGVTNNLDKRMKAHESGKGSKYVKAKGFKQLLRFKECENKSDAHKAEYQIKQLHRSEKLSWFM